MAQPVPGTTRRRFARLLAARLRENRLALAGLVLVTALALAAIAAPWVAPHDPTTIDATLILAAPSAQHLLGTDDLGRDVLSRMIYGARISLAVGFVSVGIAVFIGTTLGACAGFFGGFADALVMRFVDIMLCFPSTFLILTVIAFIGPSIWNVMFVIGVTGWMGVCRLVRAEFLSLRERDFVVAARAIGAGDARLIFRHILPNAMAPVLVAAVLGVAGAILTESGLSFLGLGVQPPTPSWGNILTAGKDNIDVAWWLSFFPGIAITLTMLGYNMLGEGLRDALDPRLGGSE
jgi:peptide/nickel transport system permease protein